MLRRATEELELRVRTPSEAGSRWDDEQDRTVCTREAGSRSSSRKHEYHQQFEDNVTDPKCTGLLDPPSAVPKYFHLCEWQWKSLAVSFFLSYPFINKPVAPPNRKIGRNISPLSLSGFHAALPARRRSGSSKLFLSCFIRVIPMLCRSLISSVE